MFSVRLYYCAALLSQLATVIHPLVPYSGATRFVPNWWMAGKYVTRIKESKLILGLS